MDWSRNMFHNKPTQEWLDNNNILMCSTYNEGKSVNVESFIKALKAINSIKKWQLTIENFILVIWII